MLKKLAVHCLASAGIPRSHAEFKDIFGFVYRGATFALVRLFFPPFFVCGLIVACNERGQRSQVKTMHISAQAAEAVVEAHVKMYVLTVGAHNSSGG